jgi:hypothetical protein
MDVYPDHEPTLIEWGTNVHLNHPITAQQETHEFVTCSMGVVDASPLCPAEGRRRGIWTRQRARPDHLDWAQARGLDAQLHFLVCTERRRASMRAHGTTEVG